MTPAPPELSDEEAGSLPLAGATALQVLQRLSLAAGQSLLVWGAAGGVGHLLVQLADQSGLQVAAIASDAESARLHDLGAETVVDRHATSPARSATVAMARQFDGAVDLVGGQAAAILPELVPGGQLAAIASLEGELDLALDRNISLHGVLVQPEADALRALAGAVRKGLRPRVVASYPLRDAAAAYRRLALGGVRGKLVLVPNGQSPVPP